MWQLWYGGIKMKKLLLFIILVFIFTMFSCDDTSDKDEFNPALLLLFGTHKLTVNVTYNGLYDTDSSKPGTQYVYVYLYDQRPTYTRSPVCVYSGLSAGPMTDDTLQSITIEGIASGDYYVLVFYDYRQGDNADNQLDRYILYNGVSTGTNCINQATTINITSDEDISIEFDDTYYFPSGAGGGAGALFDDSGC